MKLRECPFCGGEPTESNEADEVSGTVYWIECGSGVCGARTDPFFTLDSAIEAWNTRTIDPLITQLGEALNLFSHDDSPDGLPCWCDFDGGGGEVIPENYHQEDCIAAREAVAAYQEVKP